MARTSKCGWISPFMVFNVTYTIRKGHELDPYRFQSVVYANCIYDTICSQK